MHKSRQRGNWKVCNTQQFPKAVIRLETEFEFYLICKQKIIPSFGFPGRFLSLYWKNMYFHFRTLFKVEDQL